ncbi:homoserine kinase [Bifidobacterium sp. DSM 109958]|uniref:Homoserine kinase n=1 Tax=Bifidobacterium moraviense TaxID=2675323 RepID=A0A7Y0F376_9BIFI|nr:homoserine kinase [Bifidobacterium sp. DSM 109958]NMN01106.1 homoserine kinase [Bifidobacterium sp. DSM 109958]
MLPDISSVHVRVPATSANLGSGFDTVGLALDYHDELEFTLNANPDDVAAHIEIHGEGEDTLPRDETHLVVSTFRKACETFGLGRFGFTMVAHNRIPQARGMGSSAEAIVAGIAAAAGFAHRGELNRAAVFDLAAHIEGHPDNVAPAVYGGLTVSYDFEAPEGVGSVGIAGGEPLRRGFHAVNYPVDPDVEAFVFVPDFELSTEKAREALPRQIAHRDAVYNVSRVGLMPAAMNPSSLGADGPAQANALLFAATQDKLHQPYRAPLMPPSTALIAKLRRAGYAAAVSGAGPCVLVLHHGQAADDIAALVAPELASGHWRMLHLPINMTGVEIERR